MEYSNLKKAIQILEAADKKQENEEKAVKKAAAAKQAVSGKLMRTSVKEESVAAISKRRYEAMNGLSSSTFGTAELTKQIEAVGSSKAVLHRHVAIPGLSESGSDPAAVLGLPSNWESVKKSWDQWSDGKRKEVVQVSREEILERVRDLVSSGRGTALGKRKEAEAANAADPAKVEKAVNRARSFLRDVEEGRSEPVFCCPVCDTESRGLSELADHYIQAHSRQPGVFFKAALLSPTIRNTHSDVVSWLDDTAARFIREEGPSGLEGSSSPAAPAPSPPVAGAPLIQTLTCLECARMIDQDGAISLDALGSELMHATDGSYTITGPYYCGPGFRPELVRDTVVCLFNGSTVLVCVYNALLRSLDAARRMKSRRCPFVPPFPTFFRSCT